MTRGRPVAALLVGLLLASCAPIEAPAGPQLAPPALHEAALVAPDGARLPLRSWLPEDGRPRAIIIALHGFNDYSNFFDGAGHWLAERGIAAYAFDQRGFGGAPNRGMWAGANALTADLRAAVAAIRASNPTAPLYLFGESMGGAVIMATMAVPDLPALDGVILSAPAVWGRSSMPWYQTAALWMAVRTLPGSHVTGRGLGVLPSDNIEMLRGLGRDPQVIKSTRIDAVWGLVNLMDQAMVAAPALRGRVLILYGERDELIPPDAMREMLARWPKEGSEKRRFAVYRDGYHMLTRDLQAETVWRDLEAWVADPDAPLPSGADLYAMNKSADPANPDEEAATETGGAQTGACPGETLCVIVGPPHS